MYYSTFCFSLIGFGQVARCVGKSVVKGIDGYIPHIVIVELVWDGNQWQRSDQFILLWFPHPPLSDMRLMLLIFEVVSDSLSGCNDVGFDR